MYNIWYEFELITHPNIFCAITHIIYSNSYQVCVIGCVILIYNILFCAYNTHEYYVLPVFCAHNRLVSHEVFWPFTLADTQDLPKEWMSELWLFANSAFMHLHLPGLILGSKKHSKKQRGHPNIEGSCLRAFLFLFLDESGLILMPFAFTTHIRRKFGSHEVKRPTYGELQQEASDW